MVAGWPPETLCIRPLCIRPGSSGDGAGFTRMNGNRCS